MRLTFKINSNYTWQYFIYEDDLSQKKVRDDLFFSEFYCHDSYQF